MKKFFWYAACFLYAHHPVHELWAQENFKTPEAAVESLTSAAKAEDTKRVLNILGKEGEDIVSSGDPVADKAGRKMFLDAYENKHALEQEGDKAVLIIGEGDWPFPIPIVKKDAGWQFDTAQGREEILFRRIGRNELNTLKVSEAYVDAQNEYATMSRQKIGIPTYAQRIISSEGKKDGLYWPPKEGDIESPLGEFMAQASSEGYKHGEKPQPYHGYYYKVLTKQGAAAHGGAFDYIAEGKMIGGFALIAYPAEYGNSGVMTFEVNQDGVIYQKDLGPDTEELAAQITTYDPDTTWQKADVPVDTAQQE